MRRGDDVVTPLPSARAESLLVYLMLHRDAAVARDRLAFLLWPDSTEPQARTNLRHVLHMLRGTLPEADRLIEVGQRTLRWRPDAPCWIDVVAFETALAAGDRAALAEAVELYSGDLLEGRYDDWLSPVRTRLRQHYLGALERLAERCAADGDDEQAISVAEQLRVQDPLREATYRLLIGLYDRRGDRARAVRAYHACVSALAGELGVEPSSLTRRAYEALLPGREPSDPGGRVAPGRGPPAKPPLVGREAEWARLTALWQRAERGEPQFALVTGEAGIGKSRLLEDFADWAARQGALTSTARAYPVEGVTAYGPVAAWLRSAEFRPGLRRLSRESLGELSRVLPELADQVTGLPAPAPLTDDGQKHRLFRAAAEVLCGGGRATLLVADDVHWWDPSSLRWLHFLLRTRAGARLLVAATCRREEVVDRQHVDEVITGLRMLDRLTELPLKRLTREDTIALAERLRGSRLDRTAGRQLFEETEGNPLFVVEAVRATWRGGAPGLTAKVQAVIESRLTQLSPPALELVRVAATIGREFGTDLLAAATDAHPDQLLHALDELWRRRIIRDRGTTGYDFSHGKIREVAYAGMSPAQRRHQHLRVAEALRHSHEGQPGRLSGQLAVHYDRAGCVDDAVRCYARAAEQAEALQARTEAIGLLRRALELIATLPDGPARRRHELETRTALLPPLGGLEGFASAALASEHRRCEQLVELLAVEPAPALLRSLALARLSASDFPEAQRLGERLRALGGRDRDGAARVEAEYVLGISAFWQAEFRAARAHLGAAVDLYRPENRGTHLVRYLLDPKVVCLSRLANTWWFLGDREEAARTRDEALGYGAAIGHPASLATALVFAALLAIDMRELDRVRGYAADLKRDADRQWRPTRVSAAAFDGLVDVLDGRPGGIARIRRVLDGPGASEHAPGMRAGVVRVLLAACAVAGDDRTGLAAADLLLGMSGGAVWAAEARRLRAEFSSWPHPAGRVTPVERPRNGHGT